MPTRWKRPKVQFGDKIVTGQKTIFDQAEQAKQQGMEVSYRNADSVWKKAARDRIKHLAENTSQFTADDVIDYLDQQGIVTNNNSALGAIFQAFARAGIISSTDLFKVSRRPSRHQAPIRVWQSNLVKGGRL